MTGGWAWSQWSQDILAALADVEVINKDQTAPSAQCPPLTQDSSKAATSSPADTRELMQVPLGPTDHALGAAGTSLCISQVQDGNGSGLSDAVVFTWKGVGWIFHRRRYCDSIENQTQI